MSTSKFLVIKPLELQFPFELRKKVSCSLQLYNKTTEYVGFKFQQVRKTTPDKYSAKPNKGVMLPGSTCHITITMQGQQDAPPNMCEDKLFVKSITMPYKLFVKSMTTHKADPGSISKNIMGIMIDMFMNEFSERVDLVMLNVRNVRGTQPSCPISDGSHQYSWIRDSASNNDYAATTGFITASRQTAELLGKPSEVSGSFLRNKSSPNMKAGDTKESAVVVVSSDEDNDECYSDECYEIDHTMFTHRLTFDNMADVSIVAEKGPVALRDFPHPRHLCGCFPFETTSHEIFCNKCFCCVCEVPSPCSQWDGNNGHCHLSKKILAGV